MSHQCPSIETLNAQLKANIYNLYVLVGCQVIRYKSKGILARPQFDTYADTFTSSLNCSNRSKNKGPSKSTILPPIVAMARSNNPLLDPVLALLVSGPLSL